MVRRVLPLLLVLACRAPDPSDVADTDDVSDDDTEVAGESDTPPAESDAPDSDGHDTDPSHTDVSPVETDPPDSDPPDPHGVCVDTCSAPADCVIAGSAVYDAENWTCDGGACTWKGCLRDDECTPLGDFVCRDPGTGQKSCHQACTDVEDCGFAGSELNGPDNFDCVDGACRWTGCNDEDECAELGDFTCWDAGTGVPSCVERCSVPADCATGVQLGGAYDVDNYDCVDGRCTWMGCRTDAECRSTFVSADYACR